MTDQSEDKPSAIIIGALILTAGFLGLFGWLLSRTTTCSGGWWLWDRLSCLEPNALGDTFAGAFAPVAFLWLVAAVLLQRRELAAQRQELRESRDVALQQVEESRKNVAYIGEQTLLLKEQRHDSEESQFSSMLFSKVSNAIDDFEYIARNMKIALKTQVLHPFQSVNDRNERRLLMNYISQLERFCANLDGKQNISINSHIESVFQRMSDDLGDIVRLISRFSNSTDSHTPLTVDDLNSGIRAISSILALNMR